MLSESEKDFFLMFEDSDEFISELEQLIDFIVLYKDSHFYIRPDSKKVKRELLALAKAIDGLSVSAEAHIELSSHQWDPHCLSTLREAIEQPYLKKTSPSTRISNFCFKLKKILNKYDLELYPVRNPDTLRFLAILLEHSHLEYTPEYVIDLLQ